MNEEFDLNAVYNKAKSLLANMSPHFPDCKYVTIQHDGYCVTVYFTIEGERAWRITGHNIETR